MTSSTILNLKGDASSINLEFNHPIPVPLTGWKRYMNIIGRHQKTHSNQEIKAFYTTAKCLTIYMIKTIILNDIMRAFQFRKTKTRSKDLFAKASLVCK